VSSPDYVALMVAAATVVSVVVLIWDWDNWGDP
jgi:hypothetical protein